MGAGAAFLGDERPYEAGGRCELHKLSDKLSHVRYILSKVDNKNCPMPIYVDNLQSLKTEMETNIVQVCNWDNCKELPA